MFVSTYVTTMIDGTIKIEKKGRASIHIPAYLKKKYELTDKQKVGITDHDGMILIDTKRKIEK